MVLSSFKSGIDRARESPGIHFFLLMINLLFGFVLTVSFYRRLMDDIGRSRMGENLLRGFDYAWFAEFKFENPAFLESIDSLILPVAIGYVFLWSILSGGILEVFKPDGEGHWSIRFSHGVAKHFFFFLRLTFVTSIFYLLTYWILMIKGWDRIMDWIEDSPSPQLEFIAGVGITLLTIVVVLFLDMVFDYTRIKRVTEENRSIVSSFVGALGFCSKRLRQAASLYAALLVLSGIWIAVYLAVYPMIPQNHLAGIVLLFILQEIFMLGRIFLRTASYSTQMDYYLRARSTWGGRN